jgi:CMP-N-acetylneuraminic acid synthetase
MRIVAFVPAKGSSERVPGKNLAVLDGEHLFKRKLRQALDCPAISEVCLDTECDVLADHATDLPVTRLVRPAALATNATDGHEMFAWECSQRPDADLWVQLLCTAPFVTADTIGRAIAALLADPEADSLVGVSSAKQYCWDGATPAYGTGRIPNSVDLRARCRCGASAAARSCSSSTRSSRSTSTAAPTSPSPRPSPPASAPPR